MTHFSASSEKSDDHIAAQEVSKSGWHRSIAWFLLAMAPAFVCGWFVKENAVNVPVWDDWERVTLLKKAEDGTLDYAYLNSPHIDHRVLTQRVATLILNDWSDGDLRAEIFCSFGLLAFAGIGVWCLARQSFSSPAWAGITALILNLVLFCPIQYQNLLWAVQIAMIFPIPCLIWIAVLMRTNLLPVPLKTLIVIALAFLGVHSFGHGLALWPVAICLGLLLRSFASPQMRASAVIVLLIFSLTDYYGYFFIQFEVAAENFHSYGADEGESPPGAVNTLKVISGDESPGFKKLADFFFASMGNVLCRVFNANPLDVIKQTGRVLFLVFLAACGWMIANWRNARLFDALLPWAALGWYSVMAALAMTLGRSSLGMERLLLVRYITPTMFVWVAVIGMGSIFLHSWARRKPNSAVRGQVAVGCAVFVAMLHWPLWVYGVHKMEAWKSARYQGRVALLYLDHHQPNHPGRLDQGLPGSWDKLRERATFLREQGLLRPEPFDSLDFGSFQKVPNNQENGRKKGKDRALSDRQAAITRINLPSTPGAVGRIKGFAMIGHKDLRNADGVLLTWRKDKRDEWKVFALAEMQSIPLEATFLDTYFGQSKGLKEPESYAQWQTYFSDFPREAREVTAWVLDAQHMRAYEIAKPSVIRRSNFANGEENLDDQEQTNLPNTP